MSVSLKSPAKRAVSKLRGFIKGPVEPDRPDLLVERMTVLHCESNASLKNLF